MGYTDIYRGYTRDIYIYILVGGLEHEWIMTFHSVGNVIIPSDEVRTPSFFRGVGLPPTSI